MRKNKHKKDHKIYKNINCSCLSTDGFFCYFLLFLYQKVFSIKHTFTFSTQHLL